MKLVRKLLLPVVPVYFTITWLRNILYNANIFKSTRYDFPLICVGNLSVGGTGKSPMIEYLIRLLKEDHLVATLSRGYKRTSTGFQIADDSITVSDIGDEPYQFYQKFGKDIIVSVEANRRNGIEQLRRLKNSPEIILLDDAFQHRKVKAGLNIMLTTYDNLYVNDIVLPTGDLREPRSGAKRADIIVVTKCPPGLTNEEHQRIKKQLNLKTHQHVFFSYIDYSDSVFSKENSFSLSDLKEKFTLVTGIANAKPLVAFLKEKGLEFEHLNYGDHHNFTQQEVMELQSKHLIITTEKDYMRLKDDLPSELLYYLPIQTKLWQSEQFNKIITDYVKRD